MDHLVFVFLLLNAGFYIQQVNCGLTLEYLNERIAYDFHEVGEDKSGTVLKMKLWMYGLINFH